MRRVILSALSAHRPPAQPAWAAAARFATSDSAPQFVSTTGAATASPSPAQQQAASSAAPERPPHPYEVLVEQLKSGKLDEFKEGFRAGIVEKKIPPLLNPILELYAKKCDVRKRYSNVGQDLDAVVLGAYLNELKEAGLYKESFPDLVPLIPYHKEFEASFAAFDLVLTKIRSNATRLSPTQEIFIEEAATQVFKAITAFHSEAQVVEFIRDILDRLAKEGIHPTPFHFSRAISLLKRLGGLETLDKVWDMMTRCGARPNAYAYTDYIAACGSYVRDLRRVTSTPAGTVPTLTPEQRAYQIRDAIRKAESKFDEGVRRGEQLRIATSLMMKMHQHDIPASEAFVQKLNKNPRCQGYLLIATNALQKAQEPTPASPF